MSQSRPAFVLEEMTTSELSACREQIGLVLIPVGSLEQHGANLTLNADTALAKAAARFVAESLHPRALVAPAICWGISGHHMSFAGTITLRAETLTALVTDIVSSLQKHGFERFLLINGHSGNRACLETAVLQVHQTTNAAFIGCCQYFDLGERKGAGHAAETEISYAMYLAPQIVKVDNLTDGEIVAEKPIPEVFVPWPTERTSRNGPSGPVGKASPALGRALLAPSLDRLVEIAKQIIDQELTITPSSRRKGPSF